MQILRSAINRKTLRQLSAERAAIAAAPGENQVASLQLTRLNEAWAAAIHSIPEFGKKAAAIGASDGFRSLDAFRAAVPVLEKHDLGRQGASAHTFDFVRRTGGSTGSPTHLPSWKSEHAYERVTAAVAREWHGIGLGDSLALVWGHSHLLGDGWRGRLNGAVRQLKDLALGYTRLSAYDVTPAALDRMAAQLAASGASCVLGYAHAIDSLARRVLERGGPKLGPFKAVIATAEALPFSDSVETIEAAFHAPLLLEYGAVETGPMAYARARMPYHVVWSRFLLEASDPDAPVSDLLVTALYPRATPLFRYRIGDRVEPGAAQTNGSGGLLTFSELRGRSNQSLALPSGRTLHSEVVSHVFRSHASIRRYQLASGQGRVIGRYCSAAPLTPQDLDGLRRIAERIDPEFGSVLEFAHVDEAGLVQAASGKFPIVVPYLRGPEA